MRSIVKVLWRASKFFQLEFWPMRLSMMSIGPIRCTSETDRNCIAQLLPRLLLVPCLNYYLRLADHSTESVMVGWRKDFVHAAFAALAVGLQSRRPVLCRILVLLYNISWLDVLLQ